MVWNNFRPLLDGLRMKHGTACKGLARFWSTRFNAREIGWKKPIGVRGVARKIDGEVVAGGAAGFELPAGAVIRIINTFGSQVGATWAFPLPATGEHMSMEHTRIHAQSSRPQPGTVFYTNRHRPILEMTSDSSPRVHDWYLAACNQQRYELLGHQGGHANCEDNLFGVLEAHDIPTDQCPCPLNLFENVSFLFGDRMEIKPPLSMPRDFVAMRAHLDCLVVLSSCPQDILETNGPDRMPSPLDVEVVLPD